MQKETGFWQNGEYILRSAKIEDCEEYYRQNFSPLDKEVIYYTKSKEYFSHEEVTSFFRSKISDKEYYHFLLTANDGKIIGESVINEFNNGSANFRIAIFSKSHRSIGIGSWMINKTIEFAFNCLKLTSLELDVYSYNKRGIKAYEKAGFKMVYINEDEIHMIIENN